MAYTSHPTRVRGLKPQDATSAIPNQVVAPHAGAWIETLLLDLLYHFVWCRTPRGCVD